MDLTIHKKNFEEIVKKYDFSNPKKAEEISKFITSSKVVSYKEFSNLFNINEEDSKIFLSFISKGIKFKEEYIDPNN